MASLSSQIYLCGLLIVVILFILLVSLIFLSYYELSILGKINVDKFKNEQNIVLYNNITIYLFISLILSIFIFLVLVGSLLLLYLIPIMYISSMKVSNYKIIAKITISIMLSLLIIITLGVFLTQFLTHDQIELLYVEEVLFIQKNLEKIKKYTSISIITTFFCMFFFLILSLMSINTLFIEEKTTKNIPQENKENTKNKEITENKEIKRRQINPTSDLT